MSEPDQQRRGRPRAPAQEAAGGGGSAQPGARRSPRRRAREYVLQGLYQWLLAGGSGAEIAAQLAADEHFARADGPYFNALLGATIANAQSLDAIVAEDLDRPLKDLAPVEHAILLLATQELRGQPEVPYRVIVNEAIELAKGYGGTDGYKYVNGVLDKIARRLRSAEPA
jgi:N utilization substance protein B